MLNNFLDKIRFTLLRAINNNSGRNISSFMRYKFTYTTIIKVFNEFEANGLTRSSMYGRSRMVYITVKGTRVAEAMNIFADEYNKSK